MIGFASAERNLDWTDRRKDSNVRLASRCVERERESGESQRQVGESICTQSNSRHGCVAATVGTCIYVMGGAGEGDGTGEVWQSAILFPLLIKCGPACRPE
eukprot:5433833-Amphidinium_carterae.1